MLPAGRWLLLALALHIAWPPGGLAAPAASPAGLRHCDRAFSREVRRVVQQILLPGLGTELEGLGDRCPLAPALDRYLLQEGAKEALAGGRWRCRLEGKAFLSEAFIDAHMAHRHPHLELAQANATCLADWHAALHARQLSDYLDGVGGWATDPLPCRPSEAAVRRTACLALAERCSAGAGPDHESSGAAGRGWLHSLLTQHVCAAHTCDKRRKRSHLLTVAHEHRRRQRGLGVVAASVLCAVAAAWLLLWLVHTEGRPGKGGALAAVRRRLAAAAEAGPLPSVLRGTLRAWGAKRHQN